MGAGRLLVNGSEPSCSVVKPLVLVTVPGTVMGIVSVHVFLVVVSVMPVIVCFAELMFHVSLGEHASLAIREANPVAICRISDRRTGKILTNFTYIVVLLRDYWPIDARADVSRFIDAGQGSWETHSRTISWTTVSIHA